MKAKLLPAYQLNELLREIQRERMPRCEQKVKAEGRGRNAKLGNACAWVAKVEIDGKKYCLRHAQEFALAKLLREAK